MNVESSTAAFLEGIDRIIFDMDGVITSEQNYWNAAALTIWEMLNSNKYFGSQNIKIDLSLQEIQEIRDTIFANDELISLLKDRGINTNWDLAYVVVGVSLIVLVDSGQWKVDREHSLGLREITPHSPLLTPHYKHVYQYFSESSIQGYEIYDFIENKLFDITGKPKLYFKRHGELWGICQQVFQEWYMGDQTYFEIYGKEPEQKGKEGLVYFEQPIIPLEDLKKILKSLYSSGIRLGIGTGRPFIEIDQPITSWGIKKYFDEQSYITYDEVAEAEEKLRWDYTGTSLAKPHPYVFLKAIYGKEYPDAVLLEGLYDRKQIERTLIIGDAGSDIMAAKAISCKFAAVLTGVSGEKARKYFEEMKADYILSSIRELINS
ncbi:MAG: HAD family hydrolase [Clostridia bacterium]